MTNAYFESIDKYKDVETLNKYNELKQKHFSENEIINIIKLVSRDNARTPMQWDDTENAGFSSSKPWIEVNKNYKEVNALKDINSKDSIFNYYKNIIKYRKENYNIIESNAIFKTEGKILTMEKNNFILFANFTNENINIKSENKVLFKNYEDIQKDILRPFEVIVFEKC